MMFNDICKFKFTEGFMGKHFHRGVFALVTCMAASVVQGAFAATLVACPSSTYVYPVSPSNTAGVADFTNISKGIATLAGTGGVVQLAAGTYQLPATALSIPSKVSLCAPNGAVLKRADGFFGPIAVAGAEAAPASQVGLINLTFDGGSVFLFGSKFRVEANVFKNGVRTDKEKLDNADAFGKFGLWLQTASATQVINNDFINFEYGGVFGRAISANSAISGNTFTKVSEPIHLFCVSDTVISRNKMSQSTRMGIEVQAVADDGYGHPIACPTKNKNVTISNNEMRDWLFDPIEGNVSAISANDLVGKSAVVNNTAVCGAGCVATPRKGFALELNVVDAAVASGNLFSGFGIGVMIGAANNLSVVNNAVYDAELGVSKEPAGRSFGVLNISGNYIANAQARGIEGMWTLVYALKIENNTVVRMSSPDDQWRNGNNPFIGLALGPLSTSTSAASVTGNTVVLMGAPVAGFDARGVLLTGKPARLNLSGNWIGWVGAAGQAGYGSGIGINNGLASLNVVLHDNVFQGLDQLTLGWECDFDAAGNVAINMTTAAQNCTKSLVSGYQVTIAQPGASVSAPVGAKPGGYYSGKSFSATMPNGFAFKRWAFGDGSTRASTITDTEWFYAAAARLAVVFGFGANGALTAKEVAFTN
jgi:hypothetical protein